MMVFVDVLSGPNGLFVCISSSFLPLVINHPLGRFESSSLNTLGTWFLCCLFFEFVITDDFHPVSATNDR